MRTLQAFALLLALPAAAHAQTEEPSSPPEVKCTGLLDGHVVDRTSHEPIPGAIVSLDGEAVAIADDEGHFVLRDLCPVSIRVSAERDDYQSETLTLTVTRPASIEIELEQLEAEQELIVIEGKAEEVSTQSSTELKGEQIERTRGQSFADAISDVPGVAKLGSATGLAKPIVRGQFGRRLLLLVDSVRHRSQEWGLDHAPEVDPFAAESIEVVRGASGVRFGSDAIGGAVLIKPPPLRQEPGIDGEAHIVGISNGRGGSASGRVRTKLASMPRLAYQAEGSFKRLSAPMTPNYALDNAAVMEWNVAAAAGLKLEDAGFKLSYRHYQAKLGVCSCLNLSSSDDFFAQLERQEPINAELFDDDFGIERPFQTVAHDQLLARSRFEFDGLGSLSATYALQWDHRREFAVVRAATGAQFDFRLWTHDVDATFRHVPIHISDHVHLRGSFGVAGMAQFHDFSGLPLVPDHDAVGGGVFASERLLGHDFELEIGARYDVLTRSASIVRRDFLRLVRSDQLAENACGPGMPDPVKCDSTFHTLSASIGGLYQLTDPLSVKLNISTASRAPNPDEQYLNGTSPTLPVLGLGKPDLGAETTYSAAATVSYVGDRVAGEVSAYGNLINDYIEFAPAINEEGMPIFDVLIRGTFPRFVTQPVDALFYGVDGGVNARPASWLELGGQVSIVRAENRADNSPLAFVPPDRVRGTARLRDAEFAGFRGGFAQIGGTYVARQNRFDLTADLAPPPDAYFLLDAEIGAEKEIGDQLFKVAIRGSNLLNTRYRDYTSLLRYFADQPGWQATLRLSIHFGTKDEI